MQYWASPSRTSCSCSVNMWALCCLSAVCVRFPIRKTTSRSLNSMVDSLTSCAAPNSMPNAVSHRAKETNYTLINSFLETLNFADTQRNEFPLPLRTIRPEPSSEQLLFPLCLPHLVGHASGMWSGVNWSKHCVPLRSSGDQSGLSIPQAARPRIVNKRREKHGEELREESHLARLILVVELVLREQHLHSPASEPQSTQAHD